MEEYKMKYKNYGLWIAVASLIGLVVNDFGLLAPEKYDLYVQAILTILVAAGIISNPSIGKGFGDK